MSKGPGRIERAIGDIFAADPDGAYTTEELCERVYAVDRAEKKHRVPVLKALTRLTARPPKDKTAPWVDTYVSDTLGNQLVAFNRYSVPSLAMAVIKGTWHTNDRRSLFWLPSQWQRDERCRKQFERDDYRIRREPDGDIWWQVMEAVAERDGDAKTLAKAKAWREGRERQRQAMMRDLMR